MNQNIDPKRIDNLFKGRVVFDAVIAVLALLVHVIVDETWTVIAASAMFGVLVTDLGALQSIRKLTR